MRYVGILIMAAAAIGAGFMAADRWKERLEVLQRFRQMIYYLKGQILYANATLPEALAEVGERFLTGHESDDEYLQEPGKFFMRVCERMEHADGVPFSEIWQEEVDKLPDHFPLGAADRENLAAVGKNLGYADSAMQERTLLFYLEQTDDSIEYLKKELENRTKLYRSLGMAAGLFIMIVVA